MDNLGFLFAANAFVWGGILFYVFTIARRNAALRRDLDLLREILKKESDYERNARE
jgi:CcmD family protein